MPLDLRHHAAFSCSRHRRELIGRLCRAGWKTVDKLIARGTGGDTHPGMVAAVHTASSDLRWHPHVHALTSRGGWDNSSAWHPLPFVDTRAAEPLFRQKVIAFLAGEDLLDEDRVELLASWKSGHTGFSTHNAVTVQADDRTGLERLARYLLRPPVSLERLHLEPGLALYRHKRAARRDGELSRAERRRLRRGWAQLIRRVSRPRPVISSS